MYFIGGGNIISFRFQIRGIKFYETIPGYNDEIKSILSQLEGLEYNMTCSGLSNSYQLDSSLDLDVNAFLKSKGFLQINPIFPSAVGEIDYDSAFEINNNKVIFEIEKANKEKILYDFLKAHIYLQYEVDKVVLMTPTNWVHSASYYSLYDIAQKRLDLCLRYGMCDIKKIKSILIVGFTQFWEGREYSVKLKQELKKKCEEHFKQH